MVTRFTIFNESPSHWVCQQNAENEIVGVARMEVASWHCYSNDFESAGNDFKIGRTAGEAILRVFAEQGRGDVRSCETAQCPKHPCCRAERIGIDRLGHCTDHRERSYARGEIVPGKKRSFRR